MKLYLHPVEVNDVQTLIHDHEIVNTVANRIIELLPKGVIDRRITYDEYLENNEVKKLREEAYK